MTGNEGGRGIRAWLLALLVLVAGAGPSGRAAEPSPEEHAWGVAVRMFEGAAYDVAERELGAFVQAHTNSARLAEAYLLLAESRYQRQNPEGALALLREKLSGAGALEDRYRFWIAESLFRLGRFDEAGQEYAALQSGFPNSTNRLEAVVGQAYALSRAGKAREAFELLSKPDGVFLAAAAVRATEEIATRGYLLLGEAGLESGQAAAAEPLLGRMPAPTPQPELDWRRQYLLARVQAGAGHLDLAVQTAGALVAQLAAATNAAGLQFRADATALAGEILERKGDVAGALRMQEQNLGVGVPLARRQEAASNVARLILLSQRGEAAGAALEGVLAKFAGDPVLAPLRVAQAEVLLQRYFSTATDGRAGAMPWVRQAAQLVGGVLTNAPGPWTARAQFAAAWCAWEESRALGLAGRLGEALAAFEAAAVGLPRSLDQAVARFKAGDCQQALTNGAAALAHYWMAATNYADLPEAKVALVDHALYQAVRVATELGDLEQAERAMGLLLEAHPEGSFGEGSLLAYGQALGQLGKTGDERKLYTDYLGRFPKASRAAELGLAVARTWEKEGDWPAAAAAYAKWLETYPEHPWRGRAEYGRARCAYRAGDEAKAYELYAAFLATFPRDPMAPAARLWVADYHYNRGDYLKAEGEYQQVFLDTNAPAADDYAFRARLMAGRSAYRRTSFKEARTYFTELLNTNCPPALRPEAYYELGNTIWAGADPTNMLASLSEAILAYSRVPAAPLAGPRVVADAWLQIGKCHFQLGTADSKQYDLALAAYTNVLTNTLADVALRSQAEVGMALALESKAATASPVDRAGLLAEALAHYLAVTEGANLRPGEVADLMWLERAGMGGARLAQDLQRWEVAEKLYGRLMELAPALKEKFQYHLDQLKLRRDEAGR